MQTRNAFLFLMLICAVISACNLNISGQTGTPAAVITPTATATVDLLPPTSPPSTFTPLPAKATPTFPPVITSTSPPVTATATYAPTPTKPTGVKIDVIKMIDAKSGWAVGQFISNKTDDILKTADGGRTWKPVTPPEPDRTGKHAVAFFLDGNHAWVNYSSPPGSTPPAQFSVWRTSNGGATWKSSVTSLAGLMMDGFTPGQIGFYDANHGWLMSVLGVGMNHTYIALYKTNDSGASWSLVVSPDKNNVNMSCSKSGVWFRDINNGLLAGNCYGVVKGLYLYTTKNGGNTWSPVALPAPAGMADAFTKDTIACGADAPYFFDKNNGILMVTCTDLNTNKTSRWIYRTSNGGAAWKSSPMPRPYGGYTFLSPQKGWYLGQTAPDAFTGVNVYQTNDGGVTWKQISGTQWGGELDFVDENNGWVIVKSSSGQALVRTQNGGLSYTLLTPQLAP